jgi:excisionase family DNA binding protein
MHQKVTVSELNEIVPVDEAARFLRVGRSLVYEVVNQKRIPSIRIIVRLTTTCFDPLFQFSIT